MAGTVKKGTEFATIDVVCVSIQAVDSEDELILNTANQIQVTVATETQDKVPLIVKGVLIAQKPQVTTVTGNTIVMTDNVFNPELVRNQRNKLGIGRFSLSRIDGISKQRIDGIHSPS